MYCTTARPDIAKDLGFVGAKIPCAYGPSAGDDGFKKNVTIFREWREKVAVYSKNSFDIQLEELRKEYNDKFTLVKHTGT